MRRPEPLDPVVASDLAALEAALADAPDADAELAALVRDVRAVAPRPAPAARAALDERVAAGFPDPAPGLPKPRPRSVPGLLRRGGLIPALAVAAAALLALVVVTGVLRGGGSERATSAPAVPETAKDAGGGVAGGGSGDARSGAAPLPAPAAAPPGIAAPQAPAPAPGRKIERSVRLELGARADRFDDVTDGVIRTTQRAGGFVADSQVRRDGSGGTATFVLRIPASRLDTAVAALSGLAHVRSIEQGTTDLTGATDGTAARLRDARTRRRALVAALATASGSHAARLRGRLADARARERGLERALRELRARTSYATVDLTVTAPRKSTTVPADQDRWTPADAWHDARRGLEIAAGVLIIALAVALPLAIVGGAGALGAAAIRRRRREAALDVV
jgi:hypothetical protein